MFCTVRVLAPIVLVLSIAAQFPGTRSAGVAAAVAFPGKVAHTSPALRIKVQPSQIKIGRDVALTVTVSDSSGHPVNGAMVTITGVSRPVTGTTTRGVVKLTVRAVATGTALAQASVRKLGSVSTKLIMVPGAPATVAAIKAGLRVQAPGAKFVTGKVGADLQDRYHATTGKGQLASLALRDGSLIDLNSNTDVTIKDPLHTTLSGGELFLQVVHGGVTHEVQVGSAVAATKGTRLDVRVDSRTKSAVVTVVEGKVLVTSKGRSVLVGAGQQSTVPPNSPPNPPQPVSLAGILAWVTNLPNSTPSVVPPVLNLPQPPPVTPALPPTGLQSTTTAVDPAQGTWSGVVEVQGSVTVPAGATLTVQPGTIVEMDSGAVLHVEGTLLAQGTAVSPIIFTSAADQPQPGDWQYVAIDGQGASGSRLDYVQMFFGGWNGGDSGMLSVTGGAAPSVSNGIFSQASQFGLWEDDSSHPTIANCVFAGNASSAASLTAEGAGLITSTRLGAGQAGIEVRDSTISSGTTWHAQAAPFLLDGATVGAGTTLTIEAGAVLLMAAGASVHAEGPLVAVGTATSPIIVTSAAANPAPGDWQYMAIDGAGASGSKLAYVQMFYGSWNGGDEGMLSVTGGASPTITNSVFAQATSNGVWADDTSRPSLGNCVFAGDAGSAISVPADDATLIAGTSIGPNQPAIEVRATAISHSGVWHHQNAPFVVDGGDVLASATITIEAGSLLQMSSGAAFHVHGALIAVGSSSAPIIFTSASPTPAPGDWQYLSIDGSAARQTKLAFVQMLYGGWNGGDNGMLSITDAADPSIANSVFAQATGIGIWADNRSRPLVSNCVFAGVAGSAASLPADDGTAITGSALGAGQASIELRDTDISTGGTWHQQAAPFVLDGGDVIAGTILHVEPGMQLQLASGAAFHIHGTFLAQGTAGAPISFSSAGATPAAGNWQYVSIDGARASESRLSFVQMFYGGWNGGDNGMLSITGGARPTIENSVFARATGIGIWADDHSAPAISGCSFTFLGGPAISVPKSVAGRLHDNTVGSGAKPIELRE